MQTPAMSDAAESGEAWEDGFAEEALGEEGMEESGEGFEAEGTEGLETEEAFAESEQTGFEEGFEESEEASFEEGEGLDGFEGEGFSEEGLEESFDALASQDESVDSFEELFASAMDAADDDEFLGRLFGAARGLFNNPSVRNVANRALPLAWNLLQQGLGGGLGADAMDGFAEGMAEMESADEAEAFAPVLAGLAGRHILRAALPLARRKAAPMLSRQLARAVTRSLTRAASTAIRRQGPSGVRVLPAIVRRAVRMIGRRKLTPTTVARVMTQLARRAVANPALLRRLARPQPRARRLLQVARKRRGTWKGSWGGPWGGVGGGWGPEAQTWSGGSRTGGRHHAHRGCRSVFIRGPARIFVG